MTIIEQLELLIKCVGRDNHPEFRLNKETGDALRKLVGPSIARHFTVTNGVYHYKGIPLIEDSTAPPDEVYLISPKD